MIRSTSRSVLAGLVVVGGLGLAGCGAGQVSQTAVQQSTVDGTSAQVGSIAIRNAALEYPDDGVYAKGSDARLRMVVVNQGDATDTLTEVRSDAAAGVTLTEGTSGPGAASTSGAGTATETPSATATETPTQTPTGSAEPPQSSVTAGSGAPSQSPSGSGSASATPSDSGSAGTATAGPAPSEQPAAQIAIPPNGFVSFTGDGPSVVLTGLTNQLYPSQPLQVTLVFRRAGSVTLTIAVGAPTGQVSLAPTVTAGEG